MDEIFASLKKFDLSDADAREYINILFGGYEKRKKENRLYAENDVVPKLIIATYYACIKNPDFYDIVQSFKKKYITNENDLESVHEKKERDGLGVVYDYISKLDKNEYSSINLYTITDIHELLYSKMNKEFGGKYRTEPARFSSAPSVELCDYYFITHEMNLLRYDIDELVEEGISLGENTNLEKIFEYINKCLRLKCKLIKIHPFSDGNGRSIRAFTNLLFKLAKLPPIYVKYAEKEKYLEAMNIALINEDYSKIEGFYYYKICDSIMELDIKKNRKYIDSECKINNKKKGDK